MNELLIERNPAAFWATEPQPLPWQIVVEATTGGEALRSEHRKNERNAPYWLLTEGFAFPVSFADDGAFALCLCRHDD